MAKFAFGAVPNSGSLSLFLGFGGGGQVFILNLRDQDFRALLFLELEGRRRNFFQVYLL